MLTALSRVAPLDRLPPARVASKYSGLLMNSRYFNHSVLIMTCILVQVRHIPASWQRAGAGPVSPGCVTRQLGARQIKQFSNSYFIFISSPHKNKQGTFQIWGSSMLHRVAWMLQPVQNENMNPGSRHNDQRASVVSCQIKFCLHGCIELCHQIAFLIFERLDNSQFKIDLFWSLHV